MVPPISAVGISSGIAPVDRVAAIVSVTVRLSVIAIDRRRGRRISIGRHGVTITVSGIAVGWISIRLVSTAIIAVAAIAIATARTDGISGDGSNQPTDDRRDDFIIVMIAMVVIAVVMIGAGRGGRQS
jgi:hypothetical protein